MPWGNQPAGPMQNSHGKGRCRAVPARKVTSSVDSDASRDVGFFSSKAEHRY